MVHAPASPRRRKPRRRVTTVYLDVDIGRAAKMRAAVTGFSVSDQVNRALSRDLREDESDLRVFREREGDPSRDYEDFLAELKRRGRI